MKEENAEDLRFETNGNDTSGTTPDRVEPRRRRPLWRRLVKWLSMTLIVIALLVVAAVSLLVWMLTPDRLTPLVERYASEYLDADISAGRIELTYWSSWPRLEVQVDSLCVVSRSLDGIAPELRAALPHDADSLLAIKSLHGGVHIPNLLAGRIDLYDVCIDGLRANAVIADDGHSNFDIVPAGETTAATETAPIPEISIDRFRFINAGPIRFTSLPDSLSATLRLHDIDIPGLELPEYALSLECEARSGMTRDYNIERVNVSFDGKVSWHRDTPAAIGLHDMRLGIGADELRLDLTADVNVRDTVTVNALRLSVDAMDVTALTRHMPREMTPYIKNLDTDMRISLAAELTEPYVVSDSLTTPSMRVDVSIPDCRVRYQNATFRTFTLKASADIDGREPDRSILDVERLTIRGRAIDMNVSGRFTSLLSDPHIDALLMGRVRFDALPIALTSLIPYEVHGTVGTKAKVRMSMSQMTPARFHRIFVDGNVRLSDFTATAPDSTMTAYVSDAMLDFGTRRKSVVERDDMQTPVDSLLQVSLTVDTLHVTMPDTDIAMRQFKAELGSVNRSTSTDTASINPFGGRITADLFKALSYSAGDTARLRVREFDCMAMLSRYGGEARNPRLNLSVSARRISTGNLLNRLSFTRPSFTLSANIKPRKAVGRRLQAMLDSVSAANPGLSADSVADIVAAIRSEQRARRAAADSTAAARLRQSGEEVIDIELDDGIKGLLRRWDIRGHLTAKRGRLSTPLIPLTNRLSNIDFEFNTDSLMLRDLRYKAGQSDFTLNGTISNLRRALTSRRRIKQPVKVELSVASDTVNVNELTRALLAGSTMANDSTLESRVRQTDEDDDIDYTSDNDSISGPLIIPRNVDARLSVTARKALYSDIEFDNFSGQVLAYDGAVSLRQLSATTDMGSVDVSALYSAPDRSNMQFGLGMKVHNFKLDRLTRLIPAIDSLMPMMRNFAGHVNADLALTTDLHENMDLDLPTLSALLKIEGDSLVLMDPETFRIASKWLFFKNKERNMIDHLSAEIAIENSMLNLYPFMFNIDRYTLGVMGHNDLDMNLDYHVSVIKSPMPFKFGINIKGTTDDMSFRLGGAKIKENMVIERVAVADTVRVNLVEQFDKLFRRGARAARVGRLNFDAPPVDTTDSSTLPVTPDGEALPPRDTEAPPVNTIDLLRQAINAIPTAEK